MAAKEVLGDRNEGGSADRVRQSLTMQITLVKYQVVVNSVINIRNRAFCSLTYLGKRDAMIFV